MAVLAYSFVHIHFGVCPAVVIGVHSRRDAAARKLQASYAIVFLIVNSSDDSRQCYLTLFCHGMMYVYGLISSE